MWIRKCHLDRAVGRALPLPTQVISNEEFVPTPQTPQQKQVERLAQEIADRAARRLGVSRRAFLAGAGGMAACFLALNRVFGKPYFRVSEEELLDPAADERWPKPDFIFDVQTHFVDTRAGGEGYLSFRRLAMPLNPELRDREPQLEDLSTANFIKEVFFDSDTLLACISGIPASRERDGVLPVDLMVRMRDDVNGVTESQRVLSHGLVAPNLGQKNLDEMQRQHEELHVNAWKMYTGAEYGRGGWMMDDEQIAYPMFALTQQMGIRNVCVHKGLPLGMNEDFCNPRDIEQASLDFPELNFMVYHSGFKAFSREVEETVRHFDETGRIDWVTDLCDARRRHRQESAPPSQGGAGGGGGPMDNVSLELGSTFGQLAITYPELCAHTLGQMLAAFGDEHILWGTDSIWWGSPHWQIEAFRRFQIPQDLIDRHGYPPLSDESKRRIFGLNAARCYEVDVEAVRNRIPGDFLSQLRMAYHDAGTRPSNTQYGWVEL